MKKSSGFLDTIHSYGNKGGYNKAGRGLAIGSAAGLTAGALGHVFRPKTDPKDILTTALLGGSAAGIHNFGQGLVNSIPKDSKHRTSRAATAGVSGTLSSLPAFMALNKLILGKKYDGDNFKTSLIYSIGYGALAGLIHHTTE